MGKTRQTGSLISEGNIYLDLTNRTIGIGSTSGFSGNVRGNLTGEVNSASFDTNSSGIIVTGVATATGGFSGNFTGTVTGNSDSATKLQTARTIALTGDVVGEASFDGSSNVSIAATIQPNSVALGSDTTGDYVQSITGTSNQITVTSGTGEGSTPTLSVPNQFTAPQDVTVTRDLQVNRNLNVNGNITIGGTSATLFTTEFKVYDPDIVLGFRTDGSGIDLSNDNTANHGGVAIASTEGTPLISLYDVALGETNPATYKKFMWFKSGTFTGLGTDAWISNYAIGIGSTQVPNGVRLSAGGMQVTDTTITTPNLNVTGITSINELNVSGNIGIGTTNSSEKLQVQGNISINGTTSYGSTTTTTTTLSQIGIHSGLSASTYRSVEYTIQATQGTNFHATKILTIHNGTIAYNSEYGTIYNNATVGTFDIDLSGGNIRLLVTPASSSSTSYTINFAATKI